MLNMRPLNLNRATLVSIGEQYASSIGIDKIYDSADEAYLSLVNKIELLGGRIISIPYLEMIYRDVLLDIARFDFFIVYEPSDCGVITKRHRLLCALGHLLMHYDDQDAYAKMPIQHTTDREPLFREALIFEEGASVSSRLLKDQYETCTDTAKLARIFHVCEQTIINRLRDIRNYNNQN